LELRRALERRGRGDALLARAEALLKGQTAQKAGYGDQGQAVAQAVAVCPQRMV